MYADFSKRGLNEKSPVAVVTDEQLAAAKTQKNITGENYGALKALCEQAAEKACPGRTCVIRPGTHRGPDGPDRPFHLLARARGARRRGAGPRHAGC